MRAGLGSGFSPISRGSSGASGGRGGLRGPAQGEEGPSSAEVQSACYTLPHRLPSTSIAAFSCLCFC